MADEHVTSENEDAPVEETAGDAAVVDEAPVEDARGDAPAGPEETPSADEAPEAAGDEAPAVAAEDAPAEVVEEPAAGEPSEAPVEEPVAAQAETQVEEPVAADAEATAGPAAAAEPAEEPASPAEEPAAAPAPQSGPKPKRKRLPRAERRRRPKPKRVPAAERKPLVRLPKPEGERGRRQERQGTVVSSAMDKTIVVRVEMIKAHPKYKKVVRRSVKFHAHDERNEASVGDVVRIVETRPLSATKHWRLAEIVEAAR